MLPSVWRAKHVGIDGSRRRACPLARGAAAAGSGDAGAGLAPGRAPHALGNLQALGDRTAALAHLDAALAEGAFFTRHRAPARHPRPDGADAVRARRFPGQSPARPALRREHAAAHALDHRSGAGAGRSGGGTSICPAQGNAVRLRVHRHCPGREARCRLARRRCVGPGHRRAERQ